MALVSMARNGATEYYAGYVLPIAVVASLNLLCKEFVMLLITGEFSGWYSGFPFTSFKNVISQQLLMHLYSVSVSVDTLCR